MLLSRNKASWIAISLAVTIIFGGIVMFGSDVAAAASGASAESQPVSLVVRRDGALVDAQVVAVGRCDCGGRFRIESRSGSSNNSVNTSSFGRIDTPGKVLSHVRFGGSDDWSIRLTVSIDGRDDYVIARSSDGNP